MRTTKADVMKAAADLAAAQMIWENITSKDPGFGRRDEKFIVDQALALNMSLKAKKNFDLVFDDWDQEEDPS